jgi:hypothetical protein
MFGISGKKLIVAGALVAAGSLFGTGNAARAATYSITSGDSTISYNSDLQAVSWLVNGVNEFGGSPAGGDVLSIYNGTDFVPLADDGLTLVSDSFTKNIASATLSGNYEGDNFTITFKGILTGGAKGSGTAGLAETITVNNLGPSAPDGDNEGPVDFIIQDSFDANLNATPANDTLKFSPSGSPNTATQTDPTGVKLTYVSTPTPTLIDGTADSSVSTASVTGNEAFAFTWDLSLDPGDTGIISNSITISGQGSGAVASVPLPSSAGAALATLGGLGAVALLRRKYAAV